MSVKKFVIIGGGTAGCIVAALLSDQTSTTLLERGQPPNDFYLTVNGFVNKKAVSELTCRGDKLIIPNVFGGGSSVNGSVWIRSSLKHESWLDNFGMKVEYDFIWSYLEKTIPIEPSEKNEAIDDFARNLSDEFNVPIIPSSNCVVEGVFPVPLTRVGQCRVSSYTSFLLDRMKKKSNNLIVQPNCEVSHLEWIKENGLIKVTRVVSDQGTFNVDGEVILCAGSFGTPQILFKSNLHVEIPAIGQNLRDHPCLEFFSQCHAVKPSIYVMFFRSSENEPSPDFQVQFGFAVPRDDCPAFFFQIALLNSNSTGSVMPSTNNSLPEVVPPTLTASDELKWNMVFLKLKKVFAHPLCSGWTEKLATDNIHSFQHFVGTCQLGKVTDPDLFLLNGSSNIRICDASIIPEPTLGNPQAFVYANAMKLINILQ